MLTGMPTNYSDKGKRKKYCIIDKNSKDKNENKLEPKYCASANYLFFRILF